MWDYVTRFFSNIPPLMVELWEFGEGWYGVAVTGVSAALFALFCLGALRLRGGHGWLSAIFGTLAGSIAFWWVHGIIPSATVYVIDSARDEFEGILLPGPIPGMENAYQVFRDVVVSGQMVVGIVAFAVIALRLQKKFPGALAEGEEARPASGGYK